jgi:alpha-ketoglutarate-dependent taurine dioxygenase
MGGFVMENVETQDQAVKKLWAAKRKAIQPKAVNVTQSGVVKFDYLQVDHPLPLVISPALPGVNLHKWISQNLDQIESKLMIHGGILFRGFDVRSADDFAQVLTAFPVELMHYMEGATPRHELAEKVYTSTEFPADQTIQLHNELNYVMTWPMKIWFFCVQPSARGGATPIGDVRRVYNRLDPRVRQRFEDKGWMLVRNFSEGMGLTWRTSFRVNERSEVESYFKRARIEWEWVSENHLRTSQVRPTVERHPRTGEMVWFNHVAFWHVSSLEQTLREMLLDAYGEKGLPYNTYYGDGERIEDGVIEELRQAYLDETESFPWQRGDLLMLDNMLVAHGRATYAGDRKILVSMGQPQSRA